MLEKEELLSLEQVKQKTGMSSTSIYNKIKLEGFPKSLQMGSSWHGRARKGWKEKDIDKWARRKEAPNIIDKLRKLLRGWFKRLHHEHYRKPSGDNRI